MKTIEPNQITYHPNPPAAGSVTPVPSLPTSPILPSLPFLVPLCPCAQGIRGYNPIVQNKPNFKKDQIPTPPCITKTYADFTLPWPKKNKPNSNPILGLPKFPISPTLHAGSGQTPIHPPTLSPAPMHIGTLRAVSSPAGRSPFQPPFSPQRGRRTIATGEAQAELVESSLPPSSPALKGRRNFQPVPQERRTLPSRASHRPRSGKIRGQPLITAPADHRPG